MLKVKFPRAMSLSLMMIRAKEAGIDPDKMLYMHDRFYAASPKTLKPDTLIICKGFPGVIVSAANHGGEEDDSNWQVKFMTEFGLLVYDQNDGPLDLTILITFEGDDDESTLEGNTRVCDRNVPVQ